MFFSNSFLELVYYINRLGHFLRNNLPFAHHSNPPNIVATLNDYNQQSAHIPILVASIVFPDRVTCAYLNNDKLFLCFSYYYNFPTKNSCRRLICCGCLRNEHLNNK